jgi:hypothetical protein
MFQSYRYHNEDCPDTLEELERTITGHGLQVVKVEALLGNEHLLTLQGTQEQFLSLYAEEMRYGPAIDMDEFMDELEPVQAA